MADPGLAPGRPRAAPAGRPKVIVVTACDGAHAALAEDLFQSIRATGPRDFALGFVRIDGATPSLGPDILRADALEADLATPSAGYRVAFLNIKGMLPTLFPGFDVYLWIDADCWVQDQGWHDALVHGALIADLCAHPEYDTHYYHQPTPNDRTVAIYTNLFGLAVAQATWRYPMVNAGVFAARANSPLWPVLSDAMAGLRRTQSAHPDRALFFSDQIPLHALIYTGRLSLFPLRAVHNWQTYACQPRFDLARRMLTVPTAPFEPISLLHLAGDAKSRTFAFPEIGRSMALRYHDVRGFFDGFEPEEREPGAA